MKLDSHLTNLNSNFIEFKILIQLKRNGMQIPGKYIENSLMIMVVRKIK
jgi:hypothetical protein